MNNNTEMQQLLLKIWEENDYVLTFQANPEIRAVSDELKRVWLLTEKAEREWKSTDLEPLLGCLTGFIADLDNDIAKRYELLCDGNSGNTETAVNNEEDEENEEHASEEDDDQIHYLKTIPFTLNYKPTLVGSNSSETLGPRHSKAHTEGWAYNRVSTVKSAAVRSQDRVVEWQLEMIKKINFA